jgi:hypothetical protein
MDKLSEILSHMDSQYPVERQLSLRVMDDDIDHDMSVEELRAMLKIANRNMSSLEYWGLGLQKELNDLYKNQDKRITIYVILQ